MFRSIRMLVCFFFALLLAPLVGCDDDENPMNGGDTSKTFTVTIENVTSALDFLTSGVFNVKVGGSTPGPIGPGEAFEFRVAGPPGARLAFATMFGQSNDLFYGPDGDGIALFDENEMPITGDVTSDVHLWDAGTEMNEEPGVGPTQAPRQGTPNTGPADGNASVRLVSDAFDYPEVGDVLRVTLTHEGNNEFTVRIENVSVEGTLMTSDEQLLAVPLSPGAYAVFAEGESDPFFTAGSPDRGEGLERIAEDGNPTDLVASIAPRTGVTTPLSPGAWAVHTAMDLFFNEGAADFGYGLARIAEDASPTDLAAYLAASAGASSSGTFTTRVGGTGPGPIFPGQMFRFEVTAEEGERLSFATMFGQSNDLFYAFGEDGIALFSAGGTPVSGDVTGSVDLWDAGSEANQWPGAGPDQAPRQSAPDTGAADPNDAVRRVNDGYDYPDVEEVIRVTIEPMDD